MSFFLILTSWMSQNRHDPTSLDWILLISYVVLQLGPLYAAWHEADGLTSIVKYFAKLTIINLSTFVLILATSTLVATFNYYDPTYVFGKHVLMEQLGECAHRFQEIQCETRADQIFKHECFALGMCLSQPSRLLQLYTFISELWRVLDTLAILGHMSALGWVGLDVGVRWWRRGYWSAPLDDILWPMKDNSGPVSFLIDWVDSFNDPESSDR
ncbi:hypothetical protein DL98DRAFT_581574 [Cadophora sp. DSE1049]|nr:hypothetical protein DL98DRAFT_581574 [Cadophora sp. DSE1049]